MRQLGIVMLVHTALPRAAQVARHWAEHGCPVVIHVDRAVARAAHDAFVQSLAGLPGVSFSRRHRCEWGTWGIIAATQDAATLMLRRYPEVRHVFLSSGACLPLRPVDDLCAWLDARPRTDFIESATTSDTRWTVGGLQAERFSLRFPFSWRRQRWLFDRYVGLQRRLGLRRRMPPGLVPHIGSQWWCLTRQTLSAILEDPDRPVYDRYFRRVWIPDESYFQSLARLWSTDIESRSLTLSKFDHQGKPHVFYDDHLHLLRRSDCFVARKIWPLADGLYGAFLERGTAPRPEAEPNPAKIDRLFTRALERRTHGRPGLAMQSRFPRPTAEVAPTATRYAVLQGFAEVFEDFPDWLTQAAGATVHGHLFAPDRAEFADGGDLGPGALSAVGAVRDANPQAFLANLIRNTRGTRQCFLFGPGDRQEIVPVLARDPNAEIAIVSGAWAVPLFQQNANFGDLRDTAARLQKTEDAQLRVLQGLKTRARVRIWTLADFVEAPMEPLQTLLSEIAPGLSRPLQAPRMRDLSGFGRFLQNLRNQGVNPYLTGDFPVGRPQHQGDPEPMSRPYLVRK